MLFLAEFYLPSGSTLGAVADRVRAGVDQARLAGADINFVEAIFLPDDESCFLLYRACDTDDITAAGSLAGLCLDRISDAIVRCLGGPHQGVTSGRAVSESFASFGGADDLRVGCVYRRWSAGNGHEPDMHHWRSDVVR